MAGDPTPDTGVAALVLAGGRSSRLGFDKALIRMDGQPLVHWLPAQLSHMFAPVVVVADQPGRFAVPGPQVFDAVPDAGPLAGIAAGLAAIPGAAAFVCACDMPLLRPALLQRLVGAFDGYDLAIPERGGRLEPLCAVYSVNCLPVIQRLLASRRLRVSGVAAEVRTRVVTEAEWRETDPHGDSFLSINTAADLALMQQHAEVLGLTLQPC